MGEISTDIDGCIRRCTKSSCPTDSSCITDNSCTTVICSSYDKENRCLGEIPNRFSNVHGIIFYNVDIVFIQPRLRRGEVYVKLRHQAGVGRYQTLSVHLKLRYCIGNIYIFSASWI